MLIVLGYCRKDFQKAIDLLEWISELGGKQTNHELLLVAAAELTGDTLNKVNSAGCRAFDSVQTIKPNVSVEVGWPGSCNYLFRTAAAYISRTGKWKYFQWMEPDCIMLRPGAFDDVESAYLLSKKPFLGNVVHKPVDHLPGNAVYPVNIEAYNPFILHPLSVNGKEIAWDCCHPELSLKYAQHSELFQHIWIEDGTDRPQTFPTLDSLSVIRKDAAFFHRNKDHTLIDRLREQRKLARLESLSTVYSYYEDLSRPEEIKVIDLWRKSWESNGWRTVLLGDKNTSGYPGKESFIDKVSKLPSVNPEGYDLACYKRWMAMAEIGGLMVDYDVMNYGFTPAIAAQHMDDSSLMFFEEKVPCAVLANKNRFKQACDYMEDYKLRVDDLYAGRPHVSDMTILQRAWGNSWLKHCPMVKQFKEPGWAESLLVHYSNGSTNGDKVSAIRLRK
jgi:hypothetical protein